MNYFEDTHLRFFETFSPISVAHQPRNWYYQNEAIPFLFLCASSLRKSRDLVEDVVNSAYAFVFCDVDAGLLRSA